MLGQHPKHVLFTDSVMVFCLEPGHLRHNARSILEACVTPGIALANFKTTDFWDGDVN